MEALSQPNALHQSWDTEKPVGYQSPVATSSASFSSLPLEIREEIWLVTFERRTITIHYHEGHHSRSTSVALPVFGQAYSWPACGIFTASIGILHSKDRYLPEKRKYKQIVRRHSTARYTIYPEMRAKSPRGPVALEVCRESRQLALKHYQLAFAGENLEPDDPLFKVQWALGRFDLKRVWLNFKEDLIFIDEACEAREKGGISTYGRTTLELMLHFASDEAKRIQILSVEGTWDEDNRARNSLPGRLWPGLKTTFESGILKEFVSLEELVVYHNDGSPYRETWIKRDLNEVKKAVEEALRKARDQSATWTVKLPEVTVLRVEKDEVPISRLGHEYTRPASRRST